jgi:hypothetical protein
VKVPKNKFYLSVTEKWFWSALVFNYFPAGLILQKVNLPIYFGLMFGNF